MSPIFFRQSSHAVQRLLDLVFPPCCTGCGQPGSVLCAACLATIRPRTLLPPGYDLAGLSTLYAVNSYQGILRTSIHALKYDGVTRLAEPLGTLLAQLYVSYHVGADLLIPVPLHPDRYKQRGYNHAELLARICAEHIGVQYAPQLLIRTRATPAQVGLTAKQRHENMEHAFRVATTQAVYKRRIVIIDDVCTTGATLQACASALFMAGAGAVHGLVLARPV